MSLHTLFFSMAVYSALYDFHREHENRPLHSQKNFVGERLLRFQPAISILAYN